jgi:hypothetical protein
MSKTPPFFMLHFIKNIQHLKKMILPLLSKNNLEKYFRLKIAKSNFFIST